MDTDDAFDELLTPRPTACDDGLRRAMLNDTIAEVRKARGWRRRRRVILVVAAFLGLLAFVGLRIATIDLTRSPPTSWPSTQVIPVFPGGLGMGAPGGATGEPEEGPSAAALEEIGEFCESGGRAELYRRAGDRYLEESADPRSALRCYTQALDEGSREDLEISAEDSWLLMALKMDRRKEKEDGRRD
jgi:hypothetical protein